MTVLRLLNRYFNEGSLSRGDRVLAEFLPSFILYKNVAKIKQNANILSHVKSQNSLTSSMTISSYSSENSVVQEIADHLKDNLSDQLYGAILHGSLADGSEIPYSDFDGLIILRDSILKDYKQIIHTAFHLNYTYAMMLRHDPLQHHGWMIVPESALNDWPVDFFPPEILPFSKSLTGHELSLTVSYRNDQTLSKERFLNFSRSLINRLEQTGIPSNAFGLKSILSEFMLLPSLFIAAQEGTGCYKKDSFERIKAYFNKDELLAMNEVSEIRRQWPDLKRRLSVENFSVFNQAVRRRQIRESNLTSLPEVQYANGLEKRMIILIKKLMKSLI